MSLKSMMFKKIKAINYEKLNKLSSDIAKRNNKSKCYVKRDMIKNFIKYGIGYTDYLKGDYINLTEEQKKTYVTTKSFYKMLKYLNDEDYIAVMRDKILFNKVFRDYIKRDFIDLRVATPDDLKKFIKGKKHVFAKPPKDFGGHGIEKIDVSDVKDASILHIDLMNKGLYLVEEEIIQHPELDKLNPYAVNSFRIVTLVENNKAYILANALRINIDDAIAIGCSDAYMRLNEDGTPACKFVDDAGKIFDTHPLTGFDFNTIKKIPYVKESYEMVKQAALLIPEIRYIGWDVALTEKGPVVIEGNEYPSYGLIQNYLLNKDNPGHLKQIKDVLGEEFKNIKLNN